MTGIHAAKTANAFGEAINFDDEQAGALPRGWIAGVTGSGTATWQVAAEPSAPSKPNVLKQSGIGTFPWCVRPSIGGRFWTPSGRKSMSGGFNGAVSTL